MCFVESCISFSVCPLPLGRRPTTIAHSSPSWGAGRARLGGNLLLIPIGSVGLRYFSTPSAIVNDSPRRFFLHLKNPFGQSLSLPVSLSVMFHSTATGEGHEATSHAYY